MNVVGKIDVNKKQKKKSQLLCLVNLYRSDTGLFNVSPMFKIWLPRFTVL